VNSPVHPKRLRECVSSTDVKSNKNLWRVTILIGRAYVENISHVRSISDTEQ
jgi:hypothetical protein